MNYKNLLASRNTSSFCNYFQVDFYYPTQYCYVKCVYTFLMTSLHCSSLELSFCLLVFVKLSN